jgi:hypothetical protein
MTGFLETVGALMLAPLPAQQRVNNEQCSDNSAVVGQRDPNALVTGSENALDNAQITSTITRDNPYGSERLPIANTDEFVVWLRVHNAHNAEITRRVLFSLYFEFCDGEFEPLSDASLLRQIKNAGITSRRLTPKKINGKLVSPTVYQIQAAKPKRGAS